jgi:hypothetical protein
LKNTSELEYRDCQMVPNFVPKIPIRIYFGGPWNGNVGIFLAIRNI